MIDISQVLPHREPFLFVDGIDEAVALDHAVGYYVVKKDEYWIPGHFPDNPVFPGVLLLEIMAQVGGFVFIDREEEKGKYAYLSKVDNLKFFRKVSVGNRVEVTAKYLREFANYAEITAVARVEGKKVSSCNIIYTFLAEL